MASVSNSSQKNPSGNITLSSARLLSTQGSHQEINQVESLSSSEQVAIKTKSPIVVFDNGSVTRLSSETTHQVKFSSVEKSVKENNSVHTITQGVGMLALNGGISLREKTNQLKLLSSESPVEPVEEITQSVAMLELDKEISPKEKTNQLKLLSSESPVEPVEEITQSVAMLELGKEISPEEKTNQLKWLSSESPVEPVKEITHSVAMLELGTKRVYDESYANDNMDRGDATKRIKFKKLKMNGKAALSEKQYCVPVDRAKHNTKLFRNLLLRSTNSAIKRLMPYIQVQQKFVDKDSSTYVTDACQVGHIDIAYELLKKHPEAATIHSTVWGTPIQTMALSCTFNSSLEDYTAFIKALQAEHANINEFKACSMIDRFETGLVDFPSMRGAIPLQYAIYNKNESLSQALIDCGANLTVRYADGLNVLEKTMEILDWHLQHCLYLDFPIISKMLSILTPYFKDFCFDTKESCESWIRAQISKYKNSDEILKEFNLMSSQAEIEAKTQADAMEM